MDNQAKKGQTSILITMIAQHYKQKVESEAFLYIPGQFSLPLAFTCARQAGVWHHDNLCYQHSILSTKILDMLYLTNKS